MREAILEAVRSGKLEDLRIAIEMNELKPIIGDGSNDDPIAVLRQMSGDGEGRDVLATIGRILESDWAAVPLGSDVENNRIFVWPRYAATGTRDLVPEDQAQLASILPPDQLERAKETGAYTYWRLGIAADGTWHSLAR